jgi:hypothetical protein
MSEHDDYRGDEQKGDGQTGDAAKSEAERIRERVEEQMGQARDQLSGLIPPDFAEHFRVARREFWLAVRSLVDARLDSIEDEAKPKQPRQSGRIDID